jgi:hypothetical protein
MTLAAVNGNLQVNVTDENGDALPGAVVVITSPSQMGERSLVTNPEGAARFNAIPPGLYEVKASFPDYGTVVNEGNPVRLDETAYVRIQLNEAMVETVRVEGRKPLVDTASTTIGEVLVPEFVDAIPVRRSDYQDKFKLLPAVGRGGNPAVHGGTSRDNIYLVDGVNTTDGFTGTFGVNFNYELVDQHSLITGGHMAEYGGVTGMVSNLVTKSGGNEWSGSVSFNRQDRDWNEDLDPDSVGADQRSAWDTSYTLGGPIVRDKLWHFTSYQKLRSETTTLVGGSPSDRPDRVFDGHRIFAKLTWQVSPDHRLQGVFHDTDEVIYNGNATKVWLDPDQFYQQDQPHTAATVMYTGTLRKNLVLESHLNIFRMDLDTVPRFPDLPPNHKAVKTRRQFGRYRRDYISDRDRDEIRADLLWFLPRGPGEHNLKLGVHWAENAYRYQDIVSGGIAFTDRQAPGDNLWSIYITDRPDPNPNGLLGRFLGLETNNEGWQCSLGGVPCVDQQAPPATFTDPADWVMTVGSTPYTPEDFAFNTPSSNADAAALGWVNYSRFTHTELGNSDYMRADTLAFYIQDDWRYKKLTVRAGVRIEKQEFENSLGQQLFSFDTTVGPRLGLSYDIRGDGKQKVFAHYGRLYDPERTNTVFFSGDMNYPLLSEQYWFEPLNDYFSYREVGGQGSPGADIAPNLETTYMDEYLVGYARELGKSMSIEITAMHRKTEDVTEDWDPVDGLGDPALYPTLQGNPTLESLGFSDRNDDGVVDTDDLDGYYVIYNPPNGFRRYDGVDVVFRKRFSRNWQMLANYAYTDDEGTVPNNSIYTYGVGDDAYFDPRLPYNYGNFFKRNHFFKVFGSYRFPFGLGIGLEAQYYSGSHKSLVGIDTPDQTTGGGIWDGSNPRIVDTLDINRDEFAVYLDIPAQLPDGSDNPALDDAIVAMIPLDLRAGRGAYEDNCRRWINLRLRYQFALKKKAMGEVFFDVFNITDDQHVTSNDYTLNATTTIDPTTISEPASYTFGDNLNTENPRSYLLGLRVSF